MAVAKAEMSTADRLGSSEGSSRAGPPQGRGVSCYACEETSESTQVLTHR